MSHHLNATGARPAHQPTSENEDTTQNRQPLAGDNGRRSPRMHQPAANAYTEEEGMDVDVSSDDEQSDRRQADGRKRDRADASPMAHGEPHLKRRRLEEGASAPALDGAQFPSSSSASTADLTKSTHSSSAYGSSSSTLSPQIRMLTEYEALGVTDELKIDEKRVIKLFWGASQTDWPEQGYALLKIHCCPEELSILLLDCGAKLLFNHTDKDTDGDTDEDTDQDSNWKLILITPDFARERFSYGLLQAQLNDPADIDSSVRTSDDDEVMADNRTTPLMIAAQWGDGPTVQLLLENNADPNLQDRAGETALMAAVKRGHQGVVRQLMRHPKTNPNLASSQGWDALSLAAELGHLEICSLLIFFGNSVIRPEGRKQPLICAAQHGYFKICELLINRGTDVDVTDEDDDCTALWYAAKGGHLQCCQLLMGKGAKTILDNGKTVLTAAAKSGSLDIFNALLEAGAPLENGSANTTPLLGAIDYGHTHIVQRLLKLKANLEEKDHIENGPLFFAIRRNKTEIARLLVEAGADPLTEDLISMTPLAIAARYGDVDLLSLMVKKGVRLNRHKSKAYYALSEAIEYGQLAAAKFLLENGAPAILRGSGNQRRHRQGLIHVLFRYRQNYEDFLPLLALLLQYKVSLYPVNEVGNDALMVAVCMKRSDIVQMLLKHGAVLGQTNIQGENALDLAASSAEEALDAEQALDAEEALDAQDSPVLSLDERLKIFILIAVASAQQPQAGPVREQALTRTHHRIIRELLRKEFLLPSKEGGGFIMNHLVLKLIELSQLVKKLTAATVEDWSPKEIEESLLDLGAPIPAIDFIATYLQALPAMKVKLLGQSNTVDTADSLAISLSVGITATMERLFLDPDAINQAYKDLGQSYYRPYLVSAATDSINVATAFALDYESQVLAPVFSNLFDHCLTVTTAPHVQPEVRLEQTPKPGIIAEKLMGLGIYAALAEAIDAAWQEAWRSASAVKTQRTQIPPTSSAASNGVMWQEYFGLDLTNGISDGLPDDMVLRFDLPPGDSDLLQQSFASALDPIITKSDILKLPGASVEVNGLYADLMHRQLNMLAQLQHGLRQAEADDALAAST